MAAEWCFHAAYPCIIGMCDGGISAAATHPMMLSRRPACNKGVCAMMQSRALWHVCHGMHAGGSDQGIWS